MNDKTSLYRRIFLKRVAAAGLIYASGMLGFAEQALGARTLAHGRSTSPTPGKVTLRGRNEGKFLEMSRVLTGYDELDGSLVPLFLENIADKKTLAELLAVFEALPSPRNIKELMPKLRANRKYKDVAMAITQLWYTGTVMIPTAENTLYNMPAYRPVSSNAYLEGISWEVMKAHPQGQCGNGDYGYWSIAPD